jgi:DNA-binding MarR family transcriptional regulator
MGTMYFKDLYVLGRTLTDAAFRATRAAEQGLSAGEFAVLHDVYDYGPTPVSAIVARTGLAQSRVSTVVQHLAGRGWVLARTDPADRRKTLVEVADHVKDEGDRIRALDVAEALAPILDGRDAAEREWAIDALEHLAKLAARPWGQVLDEDTPLSRERPAHPAP